MAAKIEIHELRLSFIWVETFFDLLQKSVPESAPMAFIGHWATYVPKFNQILRKERKSEDLKPPWADRAGQYFWTYYLESCKSGDINGNKAWKMLVPFCGKLPVNVEEFLPGKFLNAKSFFYPYGLALVITVTIREHQSLNAAVKEALEIKRNKKFKVKWIEEDSSQSLTLNAFANKGLAILRNKVFGTAITPLRSSVTPFSIATVVRGAGVNPDLKTLEGSEIHRAIEAMTKWRPTWEHDRLSRFEDACIKIRMAPSSHLLYGQKRGRFVWFPALFIEEDYILHSLSCYHRNLVFVTMQVESLSGLVLETAKYIRTQKSLSVDHRECARRAVGILGRLYGGADSTYRSWSPRAQIEHNNLKDVINEVRDFFDMTPLS